MKTSLKKSDGLKKVVAAFLNDQSRNPPNQLWHYTNTAGLLGILRSGKLWATNTNFLNDTSELLHAKFLAKRSILATLTGTSDEVENTFLQILYEQIEGNIGRPVFVVSLSSEKDELSQWRAYGSATGSFCLGFKSNVINSAWAMNI